MDTVSSRALMSMETFDNSDSLQLIAVSIYGMEGNDQALHPPLYGKPLIATNGSGQPDAPIVILEAPAI